MFVLGALVASSLADTGHVQPRTLLTGVIPEPQEVYEFAADTDAFVFNSNTALVVEDAVDRIGAELLQKDLLTRFGLEVPIVDGSLAEHRGTFVLLARSDRAIGTLPNGYRVEQLGPTQDEGYRMAVTATAIVIQGHDARGTLYGAQTLRQLLLSNATVAPIAIRDWPEMQWRMSYCGLAGGAIDINKHIRRCARLKMNAVIVETYWNGPQNWWYNPSGGRQQLAQRFFDECRRYHIEPIPLIQGFGWGYGVTDLIPMATEGVWGEDEPVVLHVDHGTDLSRPNVVTTPDTAPIIVTSEAGEPYELNKDFAIIPGRTVRPYRNNNKRWQLQALPDGNIADGQTVRVSYNAVTPGPHKSYCPAEPRTYELVDRTIDHVMQAHHPNVVHIGHDELFNSMTDSRCLNSGMTKEQLVLRDVLHWYDRITMNNPNATIMMWYDFVRLDRGSLLDVVDQLPKDIVLCPWIYRTGKSYRTDMACQVAFEQEHGFQIVGAPSGYWLRNSLDWYDTLAGHLTPDNGSVLGMMFTFWGDGALLPSCLPASAELMWSGRQTNRDLFSRIEAATTLLKGQGLALTFELAGQRKLLTDRFNAKLLSGQSPRDIAQEFRQLVLGDETFFAGLYGETRWANLRNGAFAEQHAAMIQKLPAFVDAMALYAQAEYERSRGNGEDNGLLPSAKALFGFSLNRYRPTVAGEYIITPIVEAIMRRETTADCEHIRFTRPVALARTEGPGLTNRTVQLSHDGIAFTNLAVTNNLGVADGAMVTAIKIIPASTSEVTLYEQRAPAEIQSRPTANAPTIDGELEDPVWQRAVCVTGLFSPDGHQAIEQTRAWTTWDTDNLYVAFQCDRRPDESIASRHVTFDRHTYKDESIQLFLDTNLDRQSYYQFAVNTAGIVMDRNTVDSADKWNSDACVAAQIKDTTWTVEMAIPLASLGIADSLSGQSWGINFCRSQWGSSSVNSTWALLNPGQAYYFLQPARFGTVTFTDAPRGVCDSTDWPTYHGSTALTGVSECTLPDRPALQWQHKTGAPIHATPVAGGGRIYFCTGKGILTALTPAGKEVWSVTMTRDETDEAGHSSAIPENVKAPVLYADSMIVVGTGSGNVCAFDAKTGAPTWKCPTGGAIQSTANWTTAGPDGRRLIVVITQADGLLHGIDFDTGRIGWTSSDSARTDGSPAVSGTRVVFGSCDAALHVFSTQTGAETATIPLGEGFEIAGGVALSGHHAWTGTRAGALVCVDIQKEERLWTNRDGDGELFSTPAVTDDVVVFATDDGTVRCVSRSSGALIWTFAENRNQPESPVIAGNRVVVAAGGTLYLLVLDTGTRLWTREVADRITAPAIAYGLILVGTDDGRVVAFGGTDKE